MEILEDFDNADAVSVNTVFFLESLEAEETNRRNAEIARLNSLSKTVRHLHTSLLFFRSTSSKGNVCYEAWRTMVKHMNTSSSSSYVWSDVGRALGITQTDLNYIKNSLKFDPADVVLKLFAQNEEGTLDKILDQFIKLDRYDILSALERPLTDLVQTFNKEDSGYESSNNRPIKTEALNDVPPALIKKYTKGKEPNKPNVPILRPSNNIKDVKKNDNPIMLLTYAEDGLATADNIKDNVKNWNEMPEVTVLTLEDIKEEVYQNPETFIREYFEKADLVIPIVTTEYLENIKSHRPISTHTTDNLDCKYVSFIYNLIVNTYIHANACLNKKVRSVLPQDCPIDVLRSMTVYPELKPWTFETNFDKNFKVFLRKKIKNLTTC